MRTLIALFILITAPACNNEGLPYASPPDGGWGDLAPCGQVMHPINNDVHCNASYVYDGGVQSGYYGCLGYTLNTTCGAGNGSCYTGAIWVDGVVTNLVLNNNGDPWYWEWTASNGRGSTELLHCNNLAAPKRLSSNPCQQNADCDSGFCIPFGIGDEKYCGCRTDADCARGGALPICGQDHICSG